MPGRYTDCALSFSFHASISERSGEKTNYFGGTEPGLFKIVGAAEQRPTEIEAIVGAPFFGGN